MRHPGWIGVVRAVDAAPQRRHCQVHSVPPRGAVASRAGRDLSDAHLYRSRDGEDQELVVFSFLGSDRRGAGVPWWRAVHPSPTPMGGFLFFIFVFYKKYIFDLEIYRNIPRPPRCRAAGTWPPGSGAAGAFLKKISRRKLRAGPWGPVARQRGGRPWPPVCRATGSPTLI